MVVRSLPRGASDTVAAFTTRPVAAPMRLLHYPPQSSPDKPRIGASAHADFGAITLLMQDGNDGLQVLNKEDPGNENQWIPVPPVNGAYVVNCGDIMERWTAGDYKSAVHHVINTSPHKDRYSVAYFLEGNLDYRVKSLSHGAGSDEADSFTVEEHMVGAALGVTVLLRRVL